MPYGSSYIDYSLTLQFLCVKGFGNICMKKSQSYSVCKRQSGSFLFAANVAFYDMQNRKPSK